MADIAFLLLVFFLVTTTIDVDTGIGMVLPPPLEEDQEPPPIKERNMLAVLVNAQGQVLIDGEPASVRQIREIITRHITNNGQDERYSESPDMAIVSVKTDRQTRYDTYINVIDEYWMALRGVRDVMARQQGFPNYATYRANLADTGADQIRDAYPARLSIAEPDPGVN